MESESRSEPGSPVLSTCSSLPIAKAIIMKGEKVLMGIGASGGYTIPQTVGQAITKTLAYNLDVQQAIASPRILVNRGQGAVPVGTDLQVCLDLGFPEKAAAALGADPRRDGHAIAW